MNRPEWVGEGRLAAQPAFTHFRDFGDTAENGKQIPTSLPFHEHTRSDDEHDGAQARNTCLMCPSRESRPG